MIERPSLAVRALGVITARGPGLPPLDAGPPPERLAKVPAPAGITPRDLRRAPQLTRLAVHAAAEAAQGLSEDERRATGLILGLTHSSTALLDEFHGLLEDHGPEGTSPNAFSQGVTGAPLGAVSRLLGLPTSGLTLVGHEACGLETLSLAADALAQGRYPRCLVGAAEESSPLLSQVYRECGAYPGRKPPPHLPYPNGPGVAPRSFGLSEGAVVLHAEPWGRCSPGAPALCRYTPLERIDELGAPVDLIICGAAGGPGDRAELEWLQAVLPILDPAPALAFATPSLGETFAVGGLLQLALAIDLLNHAPHRPDYPLHPNLPTFGEKPSNPAKIKRILLIRGDRDGRTALGLCSTA